MLSLGCETCTINCLKYTVGRQLVLKQAASSNGSKKICFRSGAFILHITVVENYFFH